jgi:hypothetical protein
MEFITLGIQRRLVGESRALWRPENETSLRKIDSQRYKSVGDVEKK